MPESRSPTHRRPGVIHDLGYRPYDGPRTGAGAIAGSLFLAGLRNAFGLGRSGKSKVLPFLLLGLNLLPAVIVVGVMVIVGLDELPVDYARYASSTQILAQHLRGRAGARRCSPATCATAAIALYLARPLSSTAYAVARWAALLAATLVFLAAADPGALRRRACWASSPSGSRPAGPRRRLLLAVLLALMLTGISGLIASVSVRRGFAVVATIAVLLLGNGVVTAIQGIAEEQDDRRVGEVGRPVLAVLPLPRRDGRAHRQPRPDARRPARAMTAAYFAVMVLVGAAGLAGIVLRYRRIAGR